MTMFNCERCAACCRQIGHTPWEKTLALSNGTCRYLNPDTNLCTIYKQRPLFCNVDAYYDKFLKNEMDRKTYYALNKKECQRLRHHDSKNFR